MKALSIKNPWAGWICNELKTIETRTWEVNYRGDLLICCSKTFDENVPKGMFDKECYITGKAICVVELYDIVRMTEEHQTKAMCNIYNGAFAWRLRNVRKIEPIEVIGQLGLFNVPAGTDIKYL